MIGRLTKTKLKFVTPRNSLPPALRANNDLPQPVESLSDDFLFPMTTSRLSYASSPESDLELSPGPSASLSLGNLPQLVKSSSDPSIATNQDNLDRDREELVEGMPPPYTVRMPKRVGKFTFLPCHPHSFGIKRSLCHNRARVVGENFLLLADG